MIDIIFKEESNKLIGAAMEGYPVESTKNRRPLKLIYFEACLTQQDALHRGNTLKRQ